MYLFINLVFDRKNLCLAKISRYTVYTVHKTLHYNYTTLVVNSNS